MCKLKKKPTEYLKQIYFDSLIFSPEAIRHLAAQVGASQIVLGSDYPYPWQLQSGGPHLRTRLRSATTKRPTSSAAPRKSSSIWGRRPSGPVSNKASRVLPLPVCGEREKHRYTRTIRLPRFSPANSPISAFGVFSSPSMTSSCTFSLPDATQDCRSASACWLSFM